MSSSFGGRFSRFGVFMVGFLDVVCGFRVLGDVVGVGSGGVCWGVSLSFGGLSMWVI